MGYERTMPDNVPFSAKRWFSSAFDASKKVVVYWPVSAGTVTVVGYYESVSLANAAALAAKSGQRFPRVLINWGHVDFYKLYGNRDQREDLPDWLDEDPEY